MLPPRPGWMLKGYSWLSSSASLHSNGNSGHPKVGKSVYSCPASPPTSRFSGLPNLFGVCLYSYMCHHSLPGLVTPISNKKKLYFLILGDYTLILAFYFLLAFTGILAFRNINDLYTLNFQGIQVCLQITGDILMVINCYFQASPTDSWFLWSLHIFPSLFPVFTLSTNFPIVCITLSKNLKSLFLTEGRMYSYWTRTVVVLPIVPGAPHLRDHGDPQPGVSGWDHRELRSGWDPVECACSSGVFCKAGGWGCTGGGGQEPS